VALDPRALYIDDRNRITSGGFAAGNDCCLYLLRKHEGAAAANDVARNMLIPPFRDGGQAQFIEEPLARATPSARINLAMRYAEEHLKDAITVEALSRVAAMSPRNFARSFKKFSGTSPAAWLRLLRLRKAEELLETTDLPIASISEITGFQSPVTFRQAFQAAKTVSPQSYRNTFRTEETRSGIGK
jgi:transcriptional regulator GlxA family with amidase domain